MDALEKIEIKKELYKNTKIKIKRSSIHRWGVFAADNIEKHEILEEAPFTEIPLEETNNAPTCNAYTYWLNDKAMLLGFGYSGLYNHSFENNADYKVDKVNETITHYAIRDIKKGEEITINYGEANANTFLVKENNIND